MDTKRILQLCERAMNDDSMEGFVALRMAIKHGARLTPGPLTPIPFPTRHDHSAQRIAKLETANSHLMSENTKLRGKLSKLDRTYDADVIREALSRVKTFRELATELRRPYRQSFIVSMEAFAEREHIDLSHILKQGWRKGQGTK